jgi:endoglucanase
MSGTSFRRSACISALLLSLCGCATTAGEHTGAAIRVNQVAFLTHGAKHAVIAAPQTEPMHWQLLDSSDGVVAEGMTTVFGNDPVSGDHVHRLDFSDFRGEGDGFRIRSGSAVSHPFTIGDDAYGRLKYDALSYFYHNRSGVPIKAKYAGGEHWARPAGHPQDTATCRSDRDARGNHWPGCGYTLDLTGGWYDAGDHGKYVVNGGIAVWTLLNVYERKQALDKDMAYDDGRMPIPEAGNGVNDLLDEVRVELEFLLSMQAPPGATARVPVGIERNREDLPFTAIDASDMAHHKIADENWTSLGTAPHLSNQRRVLYPVSTAATLNLAATAAQCARIWRDIDAAFAERCLSAATRAYAAAKRNPAVYFIADFSGSGLYGDSVLSDEFFWAAAELFVTTGHRGYYADLKESPHFAAPVKRAPAWPRVAPLGLMSLALVPNDLDPQDLVAVRQGIIAAARRFRAERRQSGYYIPYARDEYPWGSNSSILNRAIMLALAYDFTGDPGYRNAVIDALDYILGRNPLDRSYVSGYGERPMRHPHHRFWARSVDSNLPPPPGVLAGGPNSTPTTDPVARRLIADGCAPQTCWRDDIRAYSLNEVTINWNAPLVWVAAFLGEPAPGNARETRATCSRHNAGRP